MMQVPARWLVSFATAIFVDQGMEIPVPSPRLTSLMLAAERTIFAAKKLSMRVLV
jgi:hypothetical protein